MIERRAAEQAEAAYAPTRGIQRFFVAVDAPSPKGEVLVVLSSYFATCARAELARRALLPQFPQCLVHSNFCKWDVDDPADEPKLLEYLLLAKRECELIQ